MDVGLNGQSVSLCPYTVMGRLKHFNLINKFTIAINKFVYHSTTVLLILRGAPKVSVKSGRGFV